MARRIPLKILGPDLATIRAALDAGDLTPEEADAEAAAAIKSGGQPCDYRNTLVAVLVHPGKGETLTTLEVRKRGKLADRIEAAEGDSIVLEDADYATVKGALDRAAWSHAGKNLLTFLDDMDAAEAVELK